MLKYLYERDSIFYFDGVFVHGCEKKEVSRYEPIGIEKESKVYRVGIHPYLNSKKMYESYRPILDYIEDRVDNVEFILETSSNYAKYNVKLYRGDFHFSLPNPFQTYNALKRDYKVIAKMKPDDVFRGTFVARKDSRLRDVKQLKDKSLSFPAPTALAATMMPLYYLFEHGIDVKKDINKKYVGSQYSSILNAYASDTIAGATWPPPWIAWCKENPKKAKEMEVVWETDSLINNGFIVHTSVDKEVSQEVAKVLVSLSDTKKGKKLLEKAGFLGFEYADDSSYQIVKSFLDKYDKAIGLPK